MGQVCPLCGCHGKHIGYRDEYPIRECCGVLLSFPYESKADYERLYTDDSTYHEHEQLREGQRGFWDRDEEFLQAARTRLQLINSWVPLSLGHAGVIDIGAGTGAFVETCKESDLAAIGVEPNEAMVQYAVERHRDVRVASWETLEHVMLSGPCAAYITAFDVFEHLADPRGFLATMKLSLLPGGLLVIEMPEAACPQQLAEGLNWKHIRPRQHICLYSDTAAQKLFAQCGWKVETLHRPKRGTLGKICYFLSLA